MVENSQKKKNFTFALPLCTSHPVQFLPIATIVHQGAEESTFILEEICRGIEFDEVTSVQDNDPIAVPNRLEAMRYSDYGHSFEFSSYRGLDQSISVVVDSSSGYKLSSEDQVTHKLEIEPSSRMSILLLRQIARAKAKICLWPREKLPPPEDTGVSSVMRLSSSSDWTLSSPEALKASLSVASSYSPNGSRFSRIVPLRSSGCCGTGSRERIE